MSKVSDEGHILLFDALANYSLPVGAYVVRRQEINGRIEDVIVNCNREFASMFNFSSAVDAIGTPLRSLYESDEDLKKFEEALTRAQVQGHPLSHWVESLQTVDGKSLTVELQCRADFDEHGDLIGRTGVVFQFSEFEFLIRDLGQMLHQFSSTLMFINYQIQPILEALAPDPFGPALNVPTADQAVAALAQPAALLSRSLSTLLEDIEQKPHAQEALQTAQWEDLHNGLRMIRELDLHVLQIEQRPDQLRDTARKVLNALRETQPGSLQRELVREVRAQAKELERQICLYGVHRVTGRIVEMGHEVTALREFVLHDLRTRESKSDVIIAELLSEAQRSMLDFAQTRNVDIRVENRVKQLSVFILQRDLLRTVENMLHNAIKYSWGKLDGDPWVTLRAYIEGQFIAIETENYGVPITKDEVGSGLVFRLGYRGRFSGDRARKGTGVGLYDALRVAKAHGGDIQIKSRPASGEVESLDYKRPFVTIVKLLIPRFPKDVR